MVCGSNRSSASTPTPTPTPHALQLVEVNTHTRPFHARHRYTDEPNASAAPNALTSNVNVQHAGPRQTPS